MFVIKVGTFFLKVVMGNKLYVYVETKGFLMFALNLQKCYHKTMEVTTIVVFL